MDPNSWMGKQYKWMQTLMYCSNRQKINVFSSLFNLKKNLKWPIFNMRTNRCYEVAIFCNNTNNITRFTFHLLKVCSRSNHMCPHEFICQLNVCIMIDLSNSKKSIVKWTKWIISWFYLNYFIWISFQWPQNCMAQRNFRIKYSWCMDWAPNFLYFI